MKCKICSKRREKKKILEINYEDYTNSTTGFNERENQRPNYIKKLEEYCLNCHKGLNKHNILGSLSSPLGHKHRCSCGWESEEFNGNYTEHDLMDKGNYETRERKREAGVTIVFVKTKKNNISPH